MHTLSELNVTPLLDLAWVLLLVFIMMATAVVQGISVDLPRASSAPGLAKPRTHAITVTADAGQSKVYGAADPGLTYVSSDLGATFTGALSRDAGESVTMEAAAAKYFASEMVGRVADRAVQIFGGAGYIADYGIERFYRDVRIFRIYEGTSQIQQVIIARETLKRGG
jgi:acyl-CoA dehydrogenase